MQGRKCSFFVYGPFFFISQGGATYVSYGNVLAYKMTYQFRNIVTSAQYLVGKSVPMYVRADCQTRIAHAHERAKN